MKELIMIAAFLVAILFVGRVEISFNPFYIRMDGWMNMVGYLLISIGIGFLGYDFYRKGLEEGLEKGFEEGSEFVIQYAKEKMEEEKKL